MGRTVACGNGTQGNTFRDLAIAFCFGQRAAVPKEASMQLTPPAASLAGMSELCCMAVGEKQRGCELKSGVILMMKVTAKTEFGFAPPLAVAAHTAHSI